MKCENPKCEITRAYLFGLLDNPLGDASIDSCDSVAALLNVVWKRALLLFGGVFEVILLDFLRLSLLRSRLTVNKLASHSRYVCGKVPCKIVVIILLFLGSFLFRCFGTLLGGCWFFFTL